MSSTRSGTHRFGTIGEVGFEANGCPIPVGGEVVAENWDKELVFDGR